MPRVRVLCSTRLVKNCAQVSASCPRVRTFSASQCGSHHLRGTRSCLGPELRGLRHQGAWSWCVILVSYLFFAKLRSVSYVSSDLGVMMDYAVDRPKCFTVPDHLWHELAVIKKRKQSKKWQGDPDALLNCLPAGGLKNKGSPNFRWQERDGIATVLPRETVYFNSLLPAMTAMTPRRFAGCSTQTAGVDMESPTRPPEGEARDPLRECREVSRQIREARNAEKARLRNAEKSRLRAMAWPKPPPPPIPPWFR